MLEASRILEKGPEFLRKQMELEREDHGRASAAERLAATKPNYVKSPQVTSSHSAPEPVTGTESTEQSAPASGTPASEQEENQLKWNSSKKRPDSILLYRQKCDLQRGSPRMNYRRKRTLLKSLRERNSAGAPVPVGQSPESSSGSDPVQAEEDDQVKDHDEDHKYSPVRRRVNVARKTIKGGGSESERASKGVSRSHSDISSRYSKNFADFDSFFKYCGLESDVVESLGKECFSARSDERHLSYAKIRSTSMAMSDDEISHTSGDVHGLQEKEVKETCHQGSSVIERNARVIKWLYSCRNASQSGKTLRDLD